MGSSSQPGEIMIMMVIWILLLTGSVIIANIEYLKFIDNNNYTPNTLPFVPLI